VQIAEAPCSPTFDVATIRETVHDEIDGVLAAHYGFTDEELDFPSSKLRTGIPSTQLRAGPSMKLRAGNYDIQYRMDETRTLSTFSGLSRNPVR